MKKKVMGEFCIWFTLMSFMLFLFSGECVSQRGRVLKDPGMSLTDTLGQLDLMLLLHYWPEESLTLLHACIKSLRCKEFKCSLFRVKSILRCNWYFIMFFFLQHCFFLNYRVFKCSKKTKNVYFVLKNDCTCRGGWGGLQHMDTVLLPNAHPCSHEVTSLPLKMFSAGPTNPN